MLLEHRVIGRGPQKVIAAHTWFADHSTFAPMFPFLDGDAFTYAFVDFRGYGASRHLTGECNIREMGRDMIDVADHLGWKAFHLLGHSMGGQAAQWVAGRIPERVQSAALVCAVPARGFPLDAATAAFFASAASQHEVRGQIGATVTGGRCGKGFVRWLVEVSVKTAPEAALSAYLKAWTENDVEAEVNGCPRPVKAFVGEFDPVLTAAVTSETVIKTFPNAELETIANAGHYPPVEAPCYTATSIEAFFTSHAA